MKTHRRVRLTAKMLRDLRPCGYGYDAALAFLPASISTDPEDNLELALRIADSERARQGFSDVYWLSLRTFGSDVGSDDAYPDESYWHRDQYRQMSDDPVLGTQHLAMVADAILRGRGR